MTSPNVERWLLKNREFITGTVLDVGSRHYDGRSASVRRLVDKRTAATSYLGVDLFAGEGVDIAVDLTGDDLDEIRTRAPDGFRTIVCLSVLEHVPQVWKMCDNLSELLVPGGAIFLSVPFVFRVHDYPTDCWRFTPQAIGVLFPMIDFCNFKYSEALTADGSTNMRLFGSNVSKLNRFVTGGMSETMKQQRKREKHDGVVVTGYQMRPTMLNFLGFKRATEPKRGQE